MGRIAVDPPELFASDAPLTCLSQSLNVNIRYVLDLTVLSTRHDVFGSIVRGAGTSADGARQRQGGHHDVLLTEKETAREATCNRSNGPVAASHLPVVLSPVSIQTQALAFVA